MSNNANLNHEDNVVDSDDDDDRNNTFQVEKNLSHKWQKTRLEKIVLYFHLKKDLKGFHSGLFYMCEKNIDNYL